MNMNTWSNGNCGHQHREVLAAAKCLRWHREHRHPDAAAEGLDAERVEAVAREIDSPTRPRSASRAAAALEARELARQRPRPEKPHRVATPEWDPEEIDGILRS